MKISLLAPGFCIVASLLLSCNKDGRPAAVGGDLPTHFIIVNNGYFSPINDTAVNGSTFTFVNHSGATVGIYSEDSTVINLQGLLDNTSFIFKKDTVGTIIYRMAGNTSASGSITLTP